MLKTHPKPMLAKSRAARWCTRIGILTLLCAPLRAQEPSDSVECVRDLAVEMRDGVTLRGDLWRPAASGDPAPMLLVRSPYGRHLEESSARGWVAQGFGVFVQAVRGRDGSEGTWIPWEHELEDGWDTIEWIAAQEWCDGRVGMLGGSYLGHTQILAAASGHPALACIFPVCPGSDGFSDVPFRGGILQLSLLSWLYQCRGPVLDLSGRLPASATDQNLAQLPLGRLDRAWGGFRSEAWQRWVAVETLGDLPGLSVWNHLKSAQRSVPALHVSGLWDGESSATSRNWEQFSAHGGDAQYLLFGPWAHNVNASTRYADVDYGPDALVDLPGIHRAWYEHWLGDTDSALEQPRVQVFATGANAWLRTDRWPATEAKPRVWHVGGNSADQTGPHARGLVPEAPAKPVQWEWSYDPADLPPSERDVYFLRTTRLWFGAEDPDALVLTTDPFDGDTLLTGPIELQLALESSAEDTDLYALLVEVSPSGEVRALQRPPPLRARFRAGYDRALPLVPGQVHELSWQLGILAHVFPRGSRLGLAVRSEWFPVGARNLGTLEPLSSATRSVTQRNRIHSGREHSSTLRLFELPLERLDR